MNEIEYIKKLKTNRIKRLKLKLFLAFINIILFSLNLYMCIKYYDWKLFLILMIFQLIQNIDVKIKRL